ncbi:MAG: hypothetical protein Q4C96_00730 [Planctomycetia bacterium]|nr:hypothetical protein [Planctomycetia bacterium]
MKRLLAFIVVFMVIFFMEGSVLHAITDVKNNVNESVPGNMEVESAQDGASARMSKDGQTDKVKAVSGETQKLQDGQEKYLLRYKWKKGETVSWMVTHRNYTQTTIRNTTEAVDARCVSEKSWYVVDVDEEGTATFTNTVPWAEMREKTGDKPLRVYDTRKEFMPPEGFEDVPESIGVELAKLTVDCQGNMKSREDYHRTSIIQQANQAYIMVPLPKDPIPVGFSWTFSYPVYVPQNTGNLLRVQMMQKYTLQKVENGIATIVYGTNIISPLSDPAIKAQLIDRIYEGKMLFHIKEGRSMVLEQKVDQEVIGFRGEASRVKVKIMYTEQVMSPGTGG